MLLRRGQAEGADGAPPAKRPRYVSLRQDTSLEDAIFGNTAYACSKPQERKKERRRKKKQGRRNEFGFGLLVQTAWTLSPLSSLSPPPPHTLSLLLIFLACSILFFLPSFLLSFLLSFFFLLVHACVGSGLSALGLPGQQEQAAAEVGFVLDRASAPSDGEGDSDDEPGRPSTLGLRRAPAWTDADDAEVEVDVSAVPRLRKLRQQPDEAVLGGKVYRKRLRAQFEKIHGGTPSWAEVPDQPAGDTLADQALQQGLPVLRTASQRLPPTVLDVARVKDANQHGVSQSVVQSAEFHPSAPAMFTAGLDKTLRLFHVRQTKEKKRKKEEEEEEEEKNR